MLRNFVYLNETALESYISALEDGARLEVSHISRRGSSAGGKVGAAGIGLEASRNKNADESTSLRDTAAARFERLELFCRANAGTTGWVEVVDPTNDLVGIGIGAMIDLECELYIPDAIRMLSQTGGFSDALAMLEKMMPAAKSLGLDMSGLPQKPGELAAMRTMTSAMASDLLVVGELPEGSPAIAGKLDGTWMHGDVEGYGRVVAKVSSVLKPGTAKPLVGLPGLNIIPREQRRKMEQDGPPPGKEADWLVGPALMLDILAIYR